MDKYKKKKIRYRKLIFQFQESFIQFVSEKIDKSSFYRGLTL